MIKKLFFLFFPFIFGYSFNLKKIVSTFFITSTLNKNLPIKDIQLPINNQVSINKNDLSDDIPYITEYSNDIRIINNDIYFYGEITSESCKDLSNVLLTLDNNLKKISIDYNTDILPINLHIQTGGGNLLNAFYIVDLIDSLKTPVNTFVDGYVASAGSLLSVIGKKRYMTKNSFIMIHQLSSAVGEGKFNYLDDNMDNLNKFMDTMYNIYLTKTRIPKEKLSEILEHDLWMNSEECLNYGLVDEII